MLTTTIALAQNNDYVVETTDGDLFYGKNIIKTDSTIILTTSFGEIKFLKESVLKATVTNGVKAFKFSNPNPTRYFFGPSAIPLKKRSGYYQNVLLSSNFVNYGLTDYISFGGGFELLSTINLSPIWFFTPKTAYKLRDNLHIGGGIFLIGVGSDNNIASVAYGLFTYGNKNSNFTLATGYGFINGERTIFAPVMANGTYRINNVISLLSENYVFPGGNQNINYSGIQGIRILSKANVFDIGFIVAPIILDGITPAFPFVGYTRVF